LSRPAFLTPRAQSELAEAVRWIAADNLGAARRFREAVYRIAAELGETLVEAADARARWARHPLRDGRPHGH
jgi:plasmid stabilization system protein ParE